MECVSCGKIICCERYGSGGCLNCNSQEYYKSCFFGFYFVNIEDVLYNSIVE